MNERIKELAEQARIYALTLENRVDDCNDVFEQKFAELIVRECVQEMETSKRCDPYTGELFVSEYNRTIDEQISVLKHHFGVEE
jgi:hypothetical protein